MLEFSVYSMILPSFFLRKTPIAPRVNQGCILVWLVGSFITATKHCDWS